MRIAVIGSGGIARRHLKVLEPLTDIEIVGHVTRCWNHAEAAAARWGGRPYSDHRVLLEKERVDAAWICVPPEAHGDIEGALIDLHIPFMVEKPIDADCGTAQRLASLIERNRLVAGVAYHWRAMDTLPAVQATLRDRPARMVMGSWLSSTPPPTWWHHEAEGGGQIVEQVTHLFDLARYLVGEAEPMAALSARHARAGYPDMDVADVSAALIRFHDGSLGSFNATCLLEVTADVSLKLVCEAMLITITQSGVTLQEGDHVRRVSLGNDPFEAEDLAFLDAVRRDDPELLFCDYQDALQTHQLCCAVRALAAL